MMTLLKRSRSLTIKVQPISCFDCVTFNQSVDLKTLMLLNAITSILY